VLRDAELVAATRVGKAVRYEVAPGVRSRESAKALSLGRYEISFDGLPSRR